MEGVEFGAVNNGRLVFDENVAAVFKRIEDNGAGVAEANLEDRPAVAVAW